MDMKKETTHKYLQFMFPRFHLLTLSIYNTLYTIEA